MSFRRADQGEARRTVDGGQPLQLLRIVTAVAVTLLIIALLGLLFAPKDPGTVALYSVVIGLNLLIALLYWPTVRWLQRITH